MVNETPPRSLLGKAAAVLALLVAVLAAGCRQAPEAPPPRQKITVAFTNQPQCALVHIAVAQGYFRAEGLDVTPLMHTYGKAALASVLEGKADIATAAETPIMFSILNGEKVLVLANIVASTSNNGVLARRATGIAVVADLKGKRVGYTPGTTSDFFLSSLLTARGIARGEVREVGLKPEQMQAALARGEVDAVSTWHYPLTQIRRALGADAIVMHDRDIYTETFNLVARQEWTLANPVAVQRFLRALVRAEQFARSQPAQAQAIMAAATKVELGLVREVWDHFQFRVGLDQILLITLEDETRWAMSNKLTGQGRMPDYLAHLYFDGLDAVRPDAVRVRR
jgi:ABC-type nitrate/sulfonate/bicarbonate transport system substrate-binding protein